MSLLVTTFLDFRVCGSCLVNMGRCSTHLHVKETARHVPLSSDSCHPWAVHKSRPVAEARRMARRSSCASVAREWIEGKIARFRHYLIDERVLRACVRIQAALLSRMACMCLSGKLAEESGSRCRLRPVLPNRLVLRDLPGAIYGLVEARNPHCLEALGTWYDVQLCWSRAGKAMVNFVL